MQAHPALVLNADFRPLSYFPHAITAVFKDHILLDVLVAIVVG
jgi:hypothetical protein